MATSNQTAVCLILFFVATSAVLQATADSGSRKTLRQQLTIASDEKPHGTKLSIRTDMTLVEPDHVKKMGKTSTERIAYHVRASIARADLLGARIRKATGKGPWVSNVTAIPGGYSMSLSLGTPSQTFKVIADTGSDLTWIQAKGCSQCFKQPDTPYDLKKSTSYKPLTCSNTVCLNLGLQSTCSDSSRNCQYTYEYGDQSTTNGDFSTEVISLTTTNGFRQHVPDFAFGVGLDNRVDFSGVDGLLGLGQGPISFPSQLGADYGQVFSYCLVSWSDSPSQTSPIVFGSGAVPSGNVQYTPLQTHENALIPTFWFLNLTGVSVGGEKIRIDSPQATFGYAGDSVDAFDKATVIDSGTTVTMLDSSTYQALTTALSAQIKYRNVPGGNSGLDYCFDTSGDSSPTFPGLTFHFEVADWVVPPENTFLPVDNKGRWCLFMLASNLGIKIFGNTQQQNFRVIYDQPNERLGWVPTQCDQI